MAAAPKSREIVRFVPNLSGSDIWELFQQYSSIGIGYEYAGLSRPQVIGKKKRRKVTDERTDKKVGHSLILLELVYLIPGTI